MIGTVQADSEMLNYSSVPDGTHLNISARGVSGGTVAVAHPATTSSVIQTPVCDQLATGGVLHVQTLKFGMNADYDSDGDGCSNWNELNNAAGSQTAGGLRDPWNRYDFFDPVPGAITKRQVLVPDILAVVQKYFKGSMDPLPDGGGLSSPDLTSAYDRTALTGGNTWNLGPPDGLQRVPDILAVVKQYFDSCANA
jgi:hypothetical protein